MPRRARRSCQPSLLQTKAIQSGRGIERNTETREAPSSSSHSEAFEVWVSLCFRHLRGRSPVRMVQLFDLRGDWTYLCYLHCGANANFVWMRNVCDECE